jgi:chromosomal replication initiator protein
MRLQMTRATFDTWLRGARVIGVQGDTLIVRVRDAYAVDWLHSRWRVPIRRTLAGIVGQEMDVRFEV